MLDVARVAVENDVNISDDSVLEVSKALMLFCEPQIFIQQRYLPMYVLCNKLPMCYSASVSLDHVTDVLATIHV